MHDRALFDFPQRDTRPAIQIALSLRSISTNITSSSLMSQVALPMAQKLANVTTSVSKKELNIARGEAVVALRNAGEIEKSFSLAR